MYFLPALDLQLIKACNSTTQNSASSPFPIGISLSDPGYIMYLCKLFEASYKFRRNCGLGWSMHDWWVARRHKPCGKYRASYLRIVQFLKFMKQKVLVAYRLRPVNVVIWDRPNKAHQPAHYVRCTVVSRGFVVLLRKSNPQIHNLQTAPVFNVIKI